MRGRIPLPSRDAFKRPGVLRRIAQLVWTTFGSCFNFRVMGLAAETAFYALLSLPPLFFGLAGAIGFIAKSVDVTSVAMFREEILRMAGRFLTPDAISSVVAPTLDDVLRNGRADVVSTGFVIALWSGSRAIAVFVDTCTIMYGARGKRGIVTSRALSFLIYLVLLTAGAVLLPLVLAGPELIDKILPDRWDWVTTAYWPVVILGSTALLATMFDIAIPIRRRWIAHLPGAVLTFGIWLLGSWGMRAFLVVTLGGASLYGPLAAPIAVMLWLYVFALGALVGAALNACVAIVWPEFAGLTPDEEAKVLEDVPDRAV